MFLWKRCRIVHASPRPLPVSLWNKCWRVLSTHALRKPHRVFPVVFSHLAEESFPLFVSKVPGKVIIPSLEGMEVRHGQHALVVNSSSTQGIGMAEFLVLTHSKLTFHACCLQCSGPLAFACAFLILSCLLRSLRCIVCDAFLCDACSAMHFLRCILVRCIFCDAFSVMHACAMHFLRCIFMLCDAFSTCLP